MVMRSELQEIVDEAARLLNAPITLEDRNFNLIAHGTQQVGIDSVREAAILARRSSRSVQDWFEQFDIATSAGPLRTPPDQEQQVRSRICLPARWRGVTYGYLWALDDRWALDDPAVSRAMELAEHAAVFLAHHDRRRENEASLLHDLLSYDSEVANDAAAEILDTGQIERGRPIAIVVVGCWRTAGHQTSHLSMWQPLGAALTARDDNGLTMLVQLKDELDLGPAEATARHALEMATAGTRPGRLQWVVAGIGSACLNLTDARTSRTHARIAARVAEAVPSEGRISHWDEIGIYRLLAAASHVDLAALLIDKAVRPLLDNSELRGTIATYLDNAGNVQQTSQALNIHRQTLYYRISKAEELTGIDLRTGHGRGRVQLALMLAPFLEPRPHSG